MINIKKLTEAQRVEVTYLNAEVDSEFVKNFRKKFELTQRALANILGVKKKTIEKWEQGVNNINGSSAILLTLIYEDAELLKKLYNVRVCASGEKCKEEFTTICIIEKKSIGEITTNTTSKTTLDVPCMAAAMSVS